MADNVYEELNKLDIHFGLPIGISRSVIARCDPTNINVLNEKLAGYGIVINGDTSISRSQRARWKVLMQQLGISKAWWLDGDPNIADLPTTIKKI